MSRSDDIGGGGLPWVDCFGPGPMNNAKSYFNRFLN
jgi:hypothetical protein